LTTNGGVLWNLNKQSLWGEFDGKVPFAKGASAKYVFRAE
jgi:hypothetical protein